MSDVFHTDVRGGFELELTAAKNRIKQLDQRIAKAHAILTKIINTPWNQLIANTDDFSEDIVAARDALESK